MATGQSKTLPLIAANADLAKRLLLPSLFVRRDEVEAQWRWFDVVRNGWAAGEIAPRSDGSGSWTPNVAIALTKHDGISWHD